MYCEDLFKKLDRLLEQKKSLDEIGKELCNEVKDRRGKVIRLIKVDEDKGEKYLIVNADWLGYDMSKISNPCGKNEPVGKSELSKEFDQKNLDENFRQYPENKNHVAAPLRYSWKPIVASSPSKGAPVQHDGVPVQPIGVPSLSVDQHEKPVEKPVEKIPEQKDILLKEGVKKFYRRVDEDIVKEEIMNKEQSISGLETVQVESIQKNKVYVVTHLRRGIIFNTAVYLDLGKAEKYRDGLVACAEVDDDIDLQTCEVIE